MAKTYQFTVPGPPVPKGRPRVGRTGARTPVRTKAHEKLIWSYALKAMVRPIEGPVMMWIDFYLTRPEQGDVDNMAKCVLDALNLTAYADDRQVVDLRCTKRHSDTPRTEVALCSAYPSPAAEG